MRKLFERLFEPKKKKTIPKDFEWEKFKTMARQQFLKLKDKGLSIPVVTL